MGTVVDEKRALARELAETRALVEQGEVRAALRRVERVRRSALAAEDVWMLAAVLDLAELVGGTAEGHEAEQAVALAFATRQNIRFLGRRQALREGLDWRDPFATDRRRAAGPKLRQGRIRPAGDVRGLAIGLLAMVLAFPLALLVAMMLVALGTHYLTLSAWRASVVAAAAVYAVGLVALLAKKFASLLAATRRQRALMIAIAVATVAGVASAGSYLAYGLGAAPVNVERPSVVGKPVLGAIVRANPGRWSPSHRQGNWFTGKAGPVTFSYHWWRCSPARPGTASSCEQIGVLSTGNPHHTIVPADLGHQLQVQVIAQGDFASEPAYPTPTLTITH